MSPLHLDHDVAPATLQLAIDRIYYTSVRMPFSDYAGEAGAGLNRLSGSSVGTDAVGANLPAVPSIVETLLGEALRVALIADRQRTRELNAAALAAMPWRLDIKRGPM